MHDKAMPSPERGSPRSNVAASAITTFTQKAQPSFAIQQLLGLTSSGSSSSNNVRHNVSNSHASSHGDHDGHHNNPDRFSHFNHQTTADLKHFSAEKFYNDAAAARNFISAATSFSDQYNVAAAQRGIPSYFNASAAAAGFFGNLQNQSAAAAAASAAAASFPPAMSPNSNMSHLLQVESSLRNDHPMHGKSSFNFFVSI